jgi:outer membrane protein TolC
MQRWGSVAAPTLSSAAGGTIAMLHTALDALRRALHCAPMLFLAMLAGCQGLVPCVAPTAGALARATAAAPDNLPEPAAANLLPPRPLPPPKTVPVALDTVFRLAEDRNGQIQLARLRLGEAEVGQELARKAWLPQVQLGTTYYRHEGGIQDFFGNLIHSSYGSLFAGADLRGRLDPRDVAFQQVDAERKVWQQRGELSKLTSENLLDAATTYADLLAARASEGLAVTIEKHLGDLLEQATALAKLDRGLRVEVERVETELRSHRVVMRKLREGGDAAAAKLAYLLGVDPECVLMPIEAHLTPLDLIDAQQAVETLLERALARGPGVRELEGLLRLIDDTRAATEGPGRYMPMLELCMNEGAFGAGPGARMNWDNQFNLALSVRWNLTEALTARERRRQADLQAAQAHTSYHDLRGRLTLGVTEARGAILSGQDQVPLAQEQVRHAEKGYELSASRLKETIKGYSPSEVLMAIRTLDGARLQLIHTLRDLNKAEIRLLLLVGNPYPSGAVSSAPM